MIFKHRRSLMKAVVMDLVYWLISTFLLLALAAWFAFVQKESSGISAGRIMFWIIGAASALGAWKIIRISQGKGEWVIQISPYEVIWRVPENIGQESFRVPVSEIVKVVCVLSRSDESLQRHFIETTQGKQYLLDPSISGIHIGKFCIALEKLGVKYEIRHVL